MLHVNLWSKVCPYSIKFLAPSLYPPKDGYPPLGYPQEGYLEQQYAQKPQRIKEVGFLKDVRICNPPISMIVYLN